MTTGETSEAPRWLAPFLRPSPPTVEQIEAHRTREGGAFSHWWVWARGMAPVHVFLSVEWPKSFARKVPPGDPPWLWGGWPNIARGVEHAHRSLSSKELRLLSGQVPIYLAPSDIEGNPMEWP